MKGKQSYTRKPSGFKKVDARKGKRITKNASKKAFKNNNQFTASPMPRTKNSTHTT